MVVLVDSELCDAEMEGENDVHYEREVSGIVLLPSPFRSFLISRRQPTSMKQKTVIDTDRTITKVFLWLVPA